MTGSVLASWVLSNSHSLNVYGEINGEALVVGFDKDNVETIEVEYEMDEEASAFILFAGRKYYLNECLKVM